MAAPQPSNVPPDLHAACACGYDLAGLPLTDGLATCPECGCSCCPRPLRYGPSWLFKSMAFWPWLSIGFTCRVDNGFMPQRSGADSLFPLAVGAATCIAAFIIATRNKLGVRILVSIMLNAILASFVFDLMLPGVSW